MANENNPVVTRVETRAVATVRTVVIAMLIGSIAFAAGMIIGSTLITKPKKEVVCTSKNIQYKKTCETATSKNDCDFLTDIGYPCEHVGEKVE